MKPHLAHNNFPPPCDLGLPAKFTEWRPGQFESIMEVLGCDKRFCVEVQPTGFGKSLVYMGVAKLGEYRTFILTETKALQDQLVNDFGCADIRGRNCYKCSVVDGLTAANGPCIHGLKSESCIDCAYREAYRIAMEAPVVVTNYAFWIAARRSGHFLGKVDLLVMDEAHSSHDIVCSALSVGIRKAVLPRIPLEGESLQEWAQMSLRKVASAYDEMHEAVFERACQEGRSGVGLFHKAFELKQAVRSLKTIIESKGDWVCTQDEKYIQYTPVWPSDFTDKYMFGDVPKIFMVSATLRRKTMDLLGVKDYDIQERSSIFEQSRHPFYHVDTCRIDHRISDEEWKMVVQTIDQIISKRLDRRGVIHSVSYKWAEMLRRHSRFSDIFILPKTGGVSQGITQFRETPTPVVLVSPAVMTGCNFIRDDCRYQIILKVPFTDSRDPLTQRRKEVDARYSDYVTAQTIVQAHGRGMRAEDDWCETFMLDNHIAWFYRKNREFFPNDFKITHVNCVPPPLNF